MGLTPKLISEFESLATARKGVSFSQVENTYSDWLWTRDHYWPSLPQRLRDISSCPTWDQLLSNMEIMALITPDTNYFQEGLAFKLMIDLQHDLGVLVHQGDLPKGIGATWASDIGHYLNQAARKERKLPGDVLISEADAMYDKMVEDFSRRNRVPLNQPQRHPSRQAIQSMREWWLAESNAGNGDG